MVLASRIDFQVVFFGVVLFAVLTLTPGCLDLGKIGVQPTTTIVSSATTTLPANETPPGFEVESEFQKYLSDCSVDISVSGRDDCFIVGALRYSLPDLCRNVSPDRVNECYYKLAYHRLNASYCGFIEDESLAVNCLERIPSLLKDSSLRILNSIPWTTVSDGGLWIVDFSTDGVGDLYLIPEYGSSFMEFPVDDPETVDDLEFVGLSCGESRVVDVGAEGGSVVFVLEDGSRARALSEGEQYRVKSLIVEDYSCDVNSSLSLRVFSSGYHRLRLDFGRTKFRVGAIV